MLVHKDVEQGSEAWKMLRKGRLTASHAQSIGNNGKGLETYVLELMADFYSSGEKDQYSNKHIDRGNELEPVARDIYELQTGNTVEQVAFVELNEYVGASPDGLIETDGLLEIKCIDDVAYFKHLLNGEKEIDTKYLWQVQMQMLVTERKWCDLAFYNPNYKKSMLVFRIEADQEKFEALKKGFEIGIARIQDIKNNIENHG